MKIDITERQLLAIQNICETVDATIGCSEPNGNGYDFDTEMKKELRNVKRFFTKNGLLINLTSIEN